MVLSTTRPAARLPARRAPPAAPLRRRCLLAAAASARSSPSSSSTTTISLREHLVQVALPRARARLSLPTFYQADALLGELTTGSRLQSAARDQVDAAVDAALVAAFGGPTSNNTDAARLFLQRCLYRVNRLSYIFYGLPLSIYENERDPWLLALRERIERAWQPWEVGQMAAASSSAGHEAAHDQGQDSSDGAALLLARYRHMTAADVERGLLERLEKGRYRPDGEGGGDGAAAAAAASSSPSSPSSTQHDLEALRDRLNPLGYAHLLAIGAHDGLTEASRQSLVCAGTTHPAASACFRILSDEYGGGRVTRKHSTHYAAAMRACGILEAEAGGGGGGGGGDSGSSTPQQDLDPHSEAWLDLAPWQSLAAANHSFLLAQRRRHALRYFGALAAFELSGPRAYAAYASAAERVGGGAQAAAAGEGGGNVLGGYWRLHVREDSKHGPQAVEEIALPLARLYGDRYAWELLLGWDQEEFNAARATAAARRDIEACGGLDEEDVRAA
jgi:hypothetical protein